MWTFRQQDSDWAMAGAFFCPAVMGNMLRPYWGDGTKYPLPWTEVEKVIITYPYLIHNWNFICNFIVVVYKIYFFGKMQVLFPINEPGVHWATGELVIRTGVVTIFDSLPKFTRKRDWWNITMPSAFEKYLTKYLKDLGVLESKGIQADGYTLTWKRGKDVPTQGCSYGDCGIWVCINLYRLCHNMPLKVNKPLTAGLAYRERMAEYLWKYKILYSQTNN